MRMLLKFSITGAAKYISHLDLQRAFSRALRRSGLPVKITEGFNPHYIFSFASALAVGIASECEYAEIVLTDYIKPNDFFIRIKQNMPPGIIAKNAFEMKTDAPKLMAALNQAAYLADIETNDYKSVSIAVAKINGNKEVIAIKPKTGEKINVRDMIIRLVADKNIEMLLSASPQSTLRPDILIKIIEEYSGRRLFAQITRTGLYTYINGQSVSLPAAFAL